MRTIQEVGTEILTNNPSKMYVMVGSEYGIKLRYIDNLTKFYGNCYTYPTVASVINLMKTKHIIPLQPAVYIVRYDDSFISSLDNQTSKMLNRLNIIGTLVCIYDNKYNNKLDKYIPDYVVSIDPVSQHFMVKYLHADFSRIPDDIFTYVSDIAIDYNQAQNMCKCIQALPSNIRNHLTKDDINFVFGHADVSNDALMKKGIASRNFNYLIHCLDKYPDITDNIIYTILATMTELDKLLDNPRKTSDISEYLKLWNRPDVYYMFVHAYNQLKKIRSGVYTDIYSSILYLFSLLSFSPIPAPEVLE